MPEPKHLRAGELLAGLSCLAGLLWLNVYLVQELFKNTTASMASMHGFWIGMAKLGGGGWFHATWWPYWDSGMPFEYAYAPLVPALTAGWSRLTGVPLGLAFSQVTGCIYCLAPLTLFLMAWTLTRRIAGSLIAALFYSLVSPTELIWPDNHFAWNHFFSERRLNLVAVWDDAPHMAVLTLLPSIILFMARAVRTRRLSYCAAAAVTIGLAGFASPFGPVDIALAALCLLFVLRRESWKQNVSIVAGVGLAGYLICAPFLPPELFGFMHQDAGDQGRITLGSLTAVAIVALAWSCLWFYLRRRTIPWDIQFFASFALVTSAIPLISHFLNRTFLPQTDRYKLEMEMGWALAIGFGAAAALKRLPMPIRITTAVLLVAVAAEQTVTFRQDAKNMLWGGDPARSIEYRTAAWIARNLPDTRVMLPGSIAQWANAFTEIPQYGGESWSVAPNPVQRLGSEEIFHGGATPEEDARVSIAWLKAYGTGAIAVSGPNSREAWKPFAHPAKFDGVLPELWREDDVTVYAVPGDTRSLAHVIPEPSLVRSAPKPGDTTLLDRYNAAVDDPASARAAMQWQGRNRIGIHADLQAGQVLSVQVSYHPGWKATVNGRRVSVQSDGLGLMWLRPPATGASDIELNYDGGWEFRILRWLSFLTITLAVLFFPVRLSMRRLRRRAIEPAPAG